jgi:hypothetical protein
MRSGNPKSAPRRLPPPRPFSLAGRVLEAAVVAGSPVPTGCPTLERARSSAVEHLTFNQVVVGSIPTGLTSKINSLRNPIRARHIGEVVTERQPPRGIL